MTTLEGVSSARPSAWRAATCNTVRAWAQLFRADAILVCDTGTRRSGGPRSP